MSRIALLALALAFFAVPACRNVAAEEKKMSLEDIMDKFHKGKEAPVNAVKAGTATEAQLKEFLEAYKTMAATKPPQGDEAEWKKKTGALVDATQGLLDKKEGALEAYKTAVDCKACHMVFKPKK